MKKLTTKEIQKYELDLLKRLIKFLDDNNINYYLAYGSLIGAIRHKGFIPWDDDIDILIMREDYNKMLELEIDSSLGFEIVSIEKRTLPLPFAKAIDKDIELITDSIFNEYLWIDIFPIDYMPESDYECQKMFKKRNIYKSLIFLRLVDEKKLKKYYSRIKLLLVKILKKFLNKFDIYYFAEKIVNICENKKNKGNNLCHYVWSLNYVKLDKDLISEVALYDFENLKVKSFKNYDKCLKDIYGDYMKLPPESERVSHNMEAIIKDEKNK